MSTALSRSRIIVAAVALQVLTACSNSFDSDPQGTGRVVVNVQTTGAPGEGAAYLTTVYQGVSNDPGEVVTGFEELRVPADGAVTIADLPAGPVHIVLSGVPAGCVTQDGPTRDVLVLDQREEEVGFLVNCSETLSFR